MFEITKCSSYTVFELTGSFYKEVLRQNPRKTQKQFENGILRVIQYFELSGGYCIILRAPLGAKVLIKQLHDRVIYFVI